MESTPCGESLVTLGPGETQWCVLQHHHDDDEVGQVHICMIHICMISHLFITMLSMYESQT